MDLPRRPSVFLPLPWILLLPLAGCGADADSAVAGAWEAVVDTVADTVVVRTVAGSVWSDTMVLVPEVEIGVLEGAPEYMFGQIRSLDVDGEGRIWVMDGQGPELRVFDAEGRYLRTVGRQGQGPGELNRPDGGLRILSDGRVLVRDPGNNRIQVFSSEGEPLEAWPVRGNFSTSSPLWADRLDNVYTQVLMEPEADLADWRMGLVRIGPDGVPADTLAVPDAAYRAPFVEARIENSVSRSGVPFAPNETWAFHPDGYFVHGVATDYRFTLLRGDGALRVERAGWEAVPVASGEAEEARRRIEVNMRRMIPGWSWNGSEIPPRKPPYRALYVGAEGRIWVLTHRPGYRQEDPDHDPTDPESVPREWREDAGFDVFDAEGRLLGHVKAPPGFGTSPTPRFDGERVWGVTRDDFDVQRVVRYRLAPAS